MRTRGTIFTSTLKQGNYAKQTDQTVGLIRYIHSFVSPHDGNAPYGLARLAAAFFLSAVPFHLDRKIRLTCLTGPVFLHSTGISTSVSG